MATPGTITLTNDIVPADKEFVEEGGGNLAISNITHRQFDRRAAGRTYGTDNSGGYYELEQFINLWAQNQGMSFRAATAQIQIMLATMIREPVNGSDRSYSNG